MKVKDLISSLQKFNPEAEICIENNDYPFSRFFPIQPVLAQTYVDNSRSHQYFSLARDLANSQPIVIFYQ